MLPTIISGLFFFFVVMLGLSQVSMMTVFMGGVEKIGNDANGLINLLIILSLPMVIASGLGLMGFRQRFKDSWTKEFWPRIPGWLIFAFLLINLMLLTGFWSFQIIVEQSTETVNLRDLFPLFTSILSSIGALIFYALGKHKHTSSYAERNLARTTQSFN